MERVNFVVLVVIIFVVVEANMYTVKSYVEVFIFFAIYCFINYLVAKQLVCCLKFVSI